MHDKRTTDFIQNVFQNIIQEDEIKKILDDPDMGINTNFLNNELEKKYFGIPILIEDDLHKLNEKLKLKEEKSMLLAKLILPKPKTLQFLEFFRYDIFSIKKNFIIYLLIIIALYYNIFTTLISLIISSIVLLLYVNHIFYKYVYNIYLKLKETSISEARKKLEFDKLEAEIRQLDSDITIKTRGMLLDELRTAINLHDSEIIWNVHLGKLLAPGLAEIFNQKYEVSTTSKIELENIIQSMDGGSIGISGPRGAGKTMLLRSICEESIRKKHELSIFSILTSAPVDYEPRDFILHLFSLICQKIIDVSGFSNFTQINQPEISNPANSILKKLSDLLSRIGLEGVIIFISFSVFLIFMGEKIAYFAKYNGKNFEILQAMGINPSLFFIYGIFFLIIGIVLYGLRYNLNKIPTDPEELSIYLDKLSHHKIVDILSPLHIFNLAVIYFGVVSYILCLNYSRYLITSNALSSNLSALSSNRSDVLFNTSISSLNNSNLFFDHFFGINFLETLRVAGVTPNDIFYGGTFAILLGFFMMLFFNIAVRNIAEHELIKAYSGKKKKRTSDRPYNINENIVDEAIQWLEKIKFQQSYSSGWSGALKLPFGVEGGINSAVSVSENQMNLPQIVSNYNKFIKSIASDMIVLIGIDELDKLKSEEDAERFLNEIKAIFGFKNVFYIISVSENAMSNFERRGFPFRDALDSSFDKMVSVNYLDQEGAKYLIWKRIIGLPIPFLALCYCISGGLARDLIRTCRDMIEIIPEDQEMSLSNVARSLIYKDLNTKLRAISIAARKISLEPERTQFLYKLHHLEIALDSGHFNLDKLLETLNSECLRQSILIHHDNSRTDEANSMLLKIDIMKEELKIYFYFMSTITEFFTENNKYLIKEAFSKEKFDLLANSRQNLAISPCISQSLIAEFRSSYKDVYDKY
jgi:hypothetical protein